MRKPWRTSGSVSCAATPSICSDAALRLRGGETGRFFAEVLAAQLVALNPGVVDAGRAAEVMRQLSLLRPTIQGNRDALGWLRGEGAVFVPEERRERNVTLIDFDDLDRNVFQVTDEWRHKSTVYANRADVVFLIMGEYVIVHELVHLLAPNHGKVFNSFMYAYLPDWEERERRLQREHLSAIG